jgi:hypothetical protein
MRNIFQDGSGEMRLLGKEGHEKWERSGTRQRKNSPKLSRDGSGLPFFLSWVWSRFCKLDCEQNRVYSRSFLMKFVLFPLTVACLLSASAFAGCEVYNNDPVSCRQLSFCAWQDGTPASCEVRPNVPPSAAPNCFVYNSHLDWCEMNSLCYVAQGSPGYCYDRY